MTYLQTRIILFCAANILLVLAYKGVTIFTQASLIFVLAFMLIKAGVNLGIVLNTTTEGRKSTIAKIAGLFITGFDFVILFLFGMISVFSLNFWLHTAFNIEIWKQAITGLLDHWL